MAYKMGSRYFDGIFHSGGVSSFTTELTDVREGGYGRWMYCKYCYKNVRPVASHEQVPGLPPTRQALCSECGAGLTPSEEVTDHSSDSE